MGKYDALMAYGAPAAAAPASDDKYGALAAYGQPAPTAPAPSTGQSFAIGAAQGGTFGIGEELEAAGETAVSKIPGVRTLFEKLRGAGAAGGIPIDDPNATYAQRRDALRHVQHAAKEEHPWAYGAGEVTGGLATAPLFPGGAGVKIGAKAAALGAVKSGAKMGALQGFGSSEADLTKGEFRQAASDAAKSGIVGGVFGGALGYLGGKLVEKAEKNAAGWVVKDIAGEAKGASTPTARKQLADDAESAARLVLGDKALNKAIDTARHGGVDELQTAKQAISERIAGTGAKLDPHWKQIDALLPEGGVKAGDLVSHLEGEIENLRATGHTTDSAEADALSGIVSRIRGARDWGNKAVLDTEKAVEGGALDGMKVGDAVSMLTKQKALNPALAADLDGEISRITQAATTKGFDPNHIVSAKQVQRLWSDEAGVAYNSMGGINGTQAFTRKLDVARHLRDFRDVLLEQAAGGDPKVVDALRAVNKDYSALKRIEKVIDQRLNSATANAGGASVPASLSGFGHKLMHHGGLSGAGVALATGHPLAAAGMAAIPAAVAGKRIADRAVAGVVRRAGAAGADALVAKNILRLIEAGVPRATAIQAARSAATGGVIDDQYRALLGGE